MSTSPTFSYRVSNIVGAFDLHRRVDTIRIYNEWVTGRAFKEYDVTIYDDETITGWLDISPRGQKKPKMRLYPSGRGMVVGAKSEEEARKFIEEVVKEMEALHS